MEENALPRSSCLVWDGRNGGYKLWHVKYYRVHEIQVYGCAPPASLEGDQEVAQVQVQAGTYLFLRT